MNYMLLGCVLLLLVNLSDPVTAVINVQQNPRFYGMKMGKQVKLKCSATDPTLENLVVTWHKIETYEEDKVYSHKMPEFKDERAIKVRKGHLYIKNLQVNDSGIYYCKMNGTWGHGTELQVFRQVKPQVVQWRNNMKDLLIFLQGFLLLLCVIIPLVWYYKLEQKEEAVYEEPVQDHTYEGLEIEHCGDLYEDLTAFCPNPDGDASWEIESPEQE